MAARDRTPPPPARRAWVRRHPWWTLSLVLLMAMVASVAVPAFYVMSQVPLTPTIGDLKKQQAEHPSVLLTSDGQELAVYRKANRVWVPLRDISPHVTAALLAVEDQRFYLHRGLDLRRTAAAAWNSLNGRLQGGSTITQQLARNLYPEEIGRAPTIERKVKEAITALKIEQAYRKDEILEIYLNTVPFLYNTYGIEMAARTYFDKNARDLDVLESATLVGMLKGTTYYNPVLNPQRAQQRRNIVLAQLARHGKLDPAQLDELRGRPLQLNFERQDEQLGPAPHLAVLMRRWLIEWADRRGYNVYADGLVVRTTIDSRAQALAQQALNAQAERLQKLADTALNGRNGWNARRDLVDAFIRESQQFKAAREAGASETEALARLRADAAYMQALRDEKTRLQAGLVAMEPGTGYVRAWVGSRDFALDQFDHVQQARRQPGSTFKPFVYGAAFELGARATDQLMDNPVDIPDGQGRIWRPKDISQPTGEPIALRDALALSKNTITAQLMQYVGAAKVAQLAQAMGVRDSRLEEVPSIGLGTSLVSLREITAAYATIANGGQYVAPALVLQVEDRKGKVLEAFRPAAPEPALNPAANAVLLDALRAAIDRGTGSPIRARYKLQGELAGKTGTTQENTDGWFVLAHPRLVTGAWVGFNDSRISMQDPWGQGSRSALPMVGEYMQALVRARLVDPKAKFPKSPELPPDNGTGWGSLFPPPPELQPPQPVMPASGSPLPPEYGVSVGGGSLGFPAQPAIVVAPPRSQPPPEVLAMPPQRAIVVAPPRGEPSGAAPAPVLPSTGSAERGY
ncbi:penicillin-binding protein [Ramlibacter henchirensis]|uniref:Penicillin-binding protein n=1 Tax=Ramlibacter henchirensis TaxID=204072 RepID=A0A4Z0C7B9_9BURK|nr:penicillin-binding protein [Ramlibacter henchirensis]